MVVRVAVPQLTAASAPTVVDRRPAGAAEPRADRETAQYVYLGDRNLDPPPMVLVRNALTGAKGLDAASQVELVTFDVGVSTSEVRDIYRSSPPLFVGAGPAGANVLGNLVGQLIVAAFQGTSPNQSVVVTVVVKSGTKTWSVTDFGMLHSGRSIAAAVEAVLPRALASLANRVGEP